MKRPQHPAKKKPILKLLHLGKIVIGPGAIKVITDAEQTPLEFLLRHIYKDWGEVCRADKKVNDRAFENGGRILSAYSTKKNSKIWVTTEKDRSSTCIMLPEEW
jgi:hypothetical protein